MTEHRSPEDIERQLEKNREGLADSLEDLKEKFSIDTIIRQAADQLREHGGDLSTSVSRAVKENPMALTLTGVGLAWLIFGDKSGSGSGARHVERDRNEYRTGRAAGWSGADDAARPVARPYESRPARPVDDRHDLPAWARHEDHHTSSASHGAPMGERMKDTASHARDKASQASDSVRDSARDAGDAVRDRASSLRARLAEGTENLTDEGRARVIAARQRVHEAREKGMERVSRGQDRAVDLFEQQPLIAGALAVAIGAAIGAALPRTRYEDETFGEQSDALIHEAERILAEERDKVGAVAQAAAGEARDIAKETGAEAEDAARQAKADADRQASGDTAAQDLADATRDRAADATQRISDAAKEEAERQDLGKTRT